MLAVKELPRTVLAAIATRLKTIAPLEYYKALAWLTGGRKTCIAMRFSDCIQDGTAVPEVTLSDYVK
jgi:hypothetical protein